MLKGLILKLFTYPLCIFLLYTSSWMFFTVIETPTGNLKVIILGLLIFLAALTYLISDIIFTIKTLRNNNNNDNLK